MIPQREALPLELPSSELKITQELVDQFHTAFEEKSTSIPPTILSRGLTSLFQFLTEAEVDWKKLLHATQNFEYLKPFRLGMNLQIKTTLSDRRERGGFSWLTFLMEAYEGETLIAKGKTLIMIGHS